MASAFYGLTSSELEALRAAYLSAVTALATASSYTMGVMSKDGVQSSRSVTRADLPSLKLTLSEILAEIRRQDGTTPSRVAYSDFRYFAQ